LTTTLKTSWRAVPHELSGRERCDLKTETDRILRLPLHPRVQLCLGPPMHERTNASH
jgi:hypothetical protein